MRKILIILLISLFCMMLAGCKSVPGSTEISDVSKIHGTEPIQSNSQQKQDSVNAGSSAGASASDKGIDYCSAAKADDFYEEETSNSIIYDDNLCTANEDVIFSFKTEISKKTLSVCVSKDGSYIVYRYGTKEKVELEYPENKEDSWEMFTYSNYLRGGGEENSGLDLNYLSFQNEEIEYRVYDEYSAEEENDSVGVKVIDKTNNKEVDIKGISSSRIGSLVSIRDTKVKTE